MPRLPIRAIITTWKACNQNYSATARQLVIDRRTVRRRVYRGRQPWGYVCRQGVQSRSTASKHPTRALSYEAAAQVRARRETTGFCREKLAFLAKAQGLIVSASTNRRTLQWASLIRASTKRRRPRFQNGQGYQRGCTLCAFGNNHTKRISPTPTQIDYFLCDVYVAARTVKQEADVFTLDSVKEVSKAEYIALVY